jgi:hypothetical protein
VQILLAEWVSPFGHPRIKVCCRLPEAFRRLPRPSSPLTAKASTVCACSLDPITPKRLRVLEASNKPHSFRLLASTTHSEASLPHHRLRDRMGRAPNACYVPSCQRARTGLQRPTSKPLGATDNFAEQCARSVQVFFSCSVPIRDRGLVKTGGASRDRTDDPLLAKQVLSQLSYGPVITLSRDGGSRRTRTSGLTLIRGAL